MRVLSGLIRDSNLFSDKEVFDFDNKFILPQSLVDCMLKERRIEKTIYSGEEVLEAGVLEMKAANCLNGSHLTLDFKEKKVPIQPVDFYNIKEVTCFLANRAKCYIAEGKLLENLSSRNADAYMTFWDEFTPVKLHGKTLVMAVEGSSVYTHWLNDTIAAILMFSEIARDYKEYNHYIFSTTQADFHRYALERLGIDGDKVKTLQKNGPLYEFDEVEIISPVRSGFVSSPIIYEKLCGFFGERKEEIARKIYITRSDAKRRKILNEDEVLPYLKTEGFECINLSSINIDQAADFFSNATHIIAPHGAGLGNIAFCRPGTRILELYSGHISKEYWTMSNVLGLDYSCMQVCYAPGKTYMEEDERKLGFFERNALDMYIEPGLFRKKVKEWLG